MYNVVLTSGKGSVERDVLSFAVEHTAEIMSRDGGSVFMISTIMDAQIAAFRKMRMTLRGRFNGDRYWVWKCAKGKWHASIGLP